MPKYRCTIREVVLYIVEFDAENLDDARDRAESIEAEADFHPIADFHSVEERTVFDVEPANG